jgi:hypothetical protein
VPASHPVSCSPGVLRARAVPLPLSHPAVPRVVVCQYRAGDRGDHRDEGWTVWTSTDPINGALSPESHAVLLALLEKKVEFKQVKARDSGPSRPTPASLGMQHTRCVLSRQQDPSIGMHIPIPVSRHTPIQVDMSAKPQEFIELYHSIIPDKDVRERVPVLVHGPKRLVDQNTIVVRRTLRCSLPNRLLAKLSRRRQPSRRHWFEFRDACRPASHPDTHSSACTHTYRS